MIDVFQGGQDGLVQRPFGIWELPMSVERCTELAPHGSASVVVNHLRPDGGKVRQCDFRARDEVSEGSPAGPTTVADQALHHRANAC